LIDLIGWLATAVFVGSYFMKAGALRRMQMLGALLWLTYGVLLDAPPVIAANLLVMIAAGWTARRNARAERAAASRREPTR